MANEKKNKNANEELQAAILAAIALHALKNLLRIVEHGTGRIHLKRTIRHNTGIKPAATHLIIHDEHLVGKDLAKAQLGLVGRLLLRVRSQRHRNIVQNYLPPSKFGISTNFGAIRLKS